MKESVENILYGGGMVMTRNVDGRRVNSSKMKVKDQERIDMIVEMCSRHARLLVEQDWLGLYDLAWEYDVLGAVSTCKQILLEIPSEFVKPQQEAQG